jgi:hypothetical protein
MMFEGWRVPDNDTDWVKYLRDALTPPYAMRRPGDDRPLDWVERFLKAHPEKADVIADAYVTLLEEGDASQRAQILEQLPTFPIDLSDRLCRLLGTVHGSYATQPDPLSQSQSLLGRLVRTLDRLANATAVSTDAVPVLENIQRRQDGWPESFLMAFRASFPKLLPRLVTTMEKMNREEQTDFAQRLTNEAAPICEGAFDELGRTASESLRRRLGEGIKNFVRPDFNLVRRYTEIAQANEGLPTVDTTDRWPDLARRLRIPA